MTTAETVCVNVSGPALAFILYENIKAEREQEGFLLGDTNTIVTKTITDTDTHNLKLQKIVNVNAVIPCPRTCLFYNSAGQINKEKIQLILGTEFENVVAWYRYEPNNKFKLTMRTKIIHKELSQYFNITPELFSCCLLSSSSSPMKSTHQYTHTFMRWANKRFDSIPLHIDNLGQLCNTYKPKSHSSKLFSDMCTSLGVNKRNHSDWELISVIQDKMHKELMNTMAKLEKSEKRVRNSEHGIQQIRLQLEYRKSLLIEQQNEDDESHTESSMLIFVDEENNKMLENKKCDLKLSNDVKHVDEVKILKNGDVFVKDASGDVAKYKMPKEFVNYIKTDDESVIVVDATNCGSSSSNNNSSPVTYNATLDSPSPIDLTMTDEDIEELTPPRSCKKISYAQAMSNRKSK